jgi:MFS transporter, OFA family, oxalate/formate antiporter
MPFAHLVPFAQGAGMARQDAVGLIALIGLGSMAGRGVLGAVADRIGRHTAYLGCCVGLSLATLIWSASGPAMLAGFALVFGVFQGGFVALSPAVVVDCFGRRAAAGATGLLHTGRGIALLLGPPIVAFTAATLGGHAIPLALTALLGCLGCAFLSCVAERGVGRPGNPAGELAGRDAKFVPITTKQA